MEFVSTTPQWGHSSWGNELFQGDSFVRAANVHHLLWDGGPFDLLLCPSQELVRPTWGRETLHPERGRHGTAAPAICSALTQIVCHFPCAFFIGDCPVLIYKWLLWDCRMEGHNSTPSILFYLESFSFSKRNPRNRSPAQVGHFRFNSRSQSSLCDPFTLMT